MTPHWYGRVEVMTAPTALPLTFQEAVEHLRLDTTDENDTVNALNQAATDWVEQYTGRALVTQTLRYTMDRWPDSSESPYSIYLPRPPLASVVSIVYRDTDNAEQTWASSNYTVDTRSTPGRVALAYNASLPDTLSGVVNAVTINYTAGYGGASAVPEPIKVAIRLLIGHWFENREDSVTGTIQSALHMGVTRLLYPYRVVAMA